MSYKDSSKDTLFTKPLDRKFEFDEKVASVFDDMLSRSIPYYKETLKLCADFISLNAKDGRIYDLGCSTGNMLLELYGRTNCELIGLDTSQAMIDNAILKSKAYGADICFIHKDCMEAKFLCAKAFIANYTLQFIRPANRPKLIGKIYNALESGGILLLSEKMTSTDSSFDVQMIEYYHAYKEQNGYSKTQIATKREALENVLVPYSLQENLDLLKNAGFRSVEVLFKWVNFGTLIAKK